jgi:hypothetical protein
MGFQVDLVQYVGTCRPYKLLHPEFLEQIHRKSAVERGAAPKVTV